VYKYDWTQNFHPERTPIHNSVSVRAISVKYNKTHKTQLKYEIKYDLYKI